MNKVAMVTGAAGMIGSHLIEFLLERDYDVFGMDVHPLETSPNLWTASKHPKFQYTQGDIRDRQVVEKFFVADADMVFHLASVVGVRKYMEDPLSLIDINIVGTKNLIELCQKHGVRVLFTSTSEVYGRNTNVPWCESDDRVLGATSVDRWSYSSSKAVVEHMLFGLQHAKLLDMSIVRFFNVYGPRQNQIYVVSQSIYRVLRGEAPAIYDGGEQTRCFTYVGDVIEGIYKAATEPSAIGEVFNIGNPIEVRIGDVVKLCCKYAESDVEPIAVNTVELYGKVYEDIVRRVPDVSKAEKLLNWKAKTSVEDGIRQTIEWAKANPYYTDAM